jgi:hypothetical protein
MYGSNQCIINNNNNNKWRSYKYIIITYLDGPAIECGWGARFSTPVEMDPGAYLASYTKCIKFVPQVERPGHGVAHSPHLAPILKKDWSYTITPRLGLWGFFWDELCHAYFGMYFGLS